MFLRLLSPFSSFPLPGFSQPAQRWIVESPAQTEYCTVDPDGTTVLPDGRFLRPYGTTHVVAPHPFGLIVDPTGQTAVTANSGTNPLSVTILDSVFSGQPRIRQIPEGYQTDRGVLASVFMGLAIDPRDSILYVSGGQENQIYRFDLATGASRGSIDCAVFRGDTIYADGYIGDLKLSSEGRTLYAIDQINFRLIIIDVATEAVVANVPTGRYPFGLALSPRRANGLRSQRGHVRILDTARRGKRAIGQHRLGFSALRLRIGSGGAGATR